MIKMRPNYGDEKQETSFELRIADYESLTKKRPAGAGLKYIEKSFLEQIPIKDLTSIRKYQRHSPMPYLGRAEEDFGIDKSNPIKVYRRDGKNYVIGGQQTVQAVALITGSYDTLMWCMVYDENETKTTVKDNSEKADNF